MTKSKISQLRHNSGALTIYERWSPIALDSVHVHLSKLCVIWLKV